LGGDRVTEKKEQRDWRASYRINEQSEGDFGVSESERGGSDILHLERQETDFCQPK